MDATVYERGEWEIELTKEELYERSELQHHFYKLERVYVMEREENLLYVIVGMNRSVVIVLD